MPPSLSQIQTWMDNHRRSDKTDPVLAARNASLDRDQDAEIAALDQALAAGQPELVRGCKTLVTQSAPAACLLFPRRARPSLTLLFHPRLALQLALPDPFSPLPAVPA